MADAAVWAGATQGLANVAKYNQERPEREARVAEAKTRQATSEFQLQQAKQNAPLNRSRAELDLERVKGELGTERKNRLKNETFSAFDSYEADSDVRHLNNFLTSAKQNPAGKMWQQWVRFDPLVRDKETESMLASAGITDINGYFSDPELVKSKVIGIDGAGKKTLLDMNKLYQGTGYLRHADSRTIQAQMERAKLDQLLSGEQSADSMMIEKIMKENPEMGVLAAAKQYYEAKNTGKVTGSALERSAQEFMRQDPNLSYEDAIKKAARVNAAPSSAEKDIVVTEEVRQKVHEAAGGDFYSANLNDPAIRSKVGERIIDLEKATGKQLATETKRVARNLRSMVALGGIAGSELSDEETGLLDNMLHGLQKYFSDNVEGVEGTAAYSAMRNVTRNALMGATLTPKELKEFDKAAGTLSQQLGPVLQQLKVQLHDIKGQIKSIMDFEDPMMAKYYLGMSYDEADAVVEQLDRRVEMISKYDKKTGEAKPELTTPMSPVPKPKVPAVDRWKELTSGS